jgi:uncharacterized OB-fold protein
MGSARFWREIPQRYRYEANKCKKCGVVYFPPRLICAECHARDFETVTLPMEGTVFTFTNIEVPPSQFKDDAPYVVGIVDMGDVRVTGQIVDCNPETLKIGDRVKIEFRMIQEEGDAGILCYGYKFVPAI